jgi:type III pantothenate kinase
MNLTIDQGNSSTKIGFFDNGELISTYKLNFINKKNLGELISLHRPQRGILSTVSMDPEQALLDWLRTNLKSFILFDHQTPLPFTNNYKTPETLGKDRLAALAGAQSIYPDTPLLVIDAGTAITFDVLVNNEYLGGNISPGMNMRFNALHQQTSRLPLVAPHEVPFWGQSTNSAIAAGVQNGLLMEVTGYIEKIKHAHPKAKIIITGGDAYFFVRNLKSIIFVHSNLVLLGLNRLIDCNV